MLQTPVRYLKGVGPKKGEDLSRLGIRTAGDMLYYMPFRYEDRSRFVQIKELKDGQFHTVKGEVFSVATRRTRSALPVFQAAIKDGTGVIHAVWFNQPYLKDYFRRGQNVVLYGKVARYDKLQFINPEYEILKDGERDSIHIGRIVPVYALAGQLTQKYLRGLIFSALSVYASSLKEVLPTRVIARQRLVDIKFAVRNIHFPTSFENLERAYRRIVLEEFFMLQLKLAVRRSLMKSAPGGIAHNVDSAITEAFKRSLPFELTAGQKRAIADIEKDMASSRPMNRLLEGDVGSGKTVVAAYALVLTVRNGLQGVVMAPTEVLARQHFMSLGRMLMPLGINVALLVGGSDKKSRERIYSEISSGAADVVVGTHAVIQGPVSFRRPGLIVVDEQHKFGVGQRSALTGKGGRAHNLVMTATPIPRTLALTVYGDLDISVIRQLPEGRKPIVTYWVEKGRRGKVYDFMREELGKGRQAYVVCPTIDKGQGAEEMFLKLKSEVFQEYDVALLHGRMFSRQKDDIMGRFKKGSIDVLVSTVVIEVGIDVANATVMLIEDADRFGLAQLHQLRGRVGRGSHESYCILIADPETEEARRRLEAIEGTIDGFEIAEADLNLRGPGEFFGTRQHGLPEIRYGDILKDQQIMESARAEAFGLIAEDPDLKEENHRLLKGALSPGFAARAGMVNMA